MPQGALYTIGGLSASSTVRFVKIHFFTVLFPFLANFSKNERAPPFGQKLELDPSYLCWKM
jgi:hypothetical protein